MDKRNGLIIRIAETKKKILTTKQNMNCTCKQNEWICGASKDCSNIKYQILNQSETEPTIVVISQSHGIATMVWLLLAGIVISGTWIKVVVFCVIQLFQLLSFTVLNANLFPCSWMLFLHAYLLDSQRSLYCRSGKGEGTYGTHMYVPGESRK